MSENLIRTNSKKPTAVNTKFILLVGSYDPRKNIDFAIQHSKALADEWNLKLVRVGRSSHVFSGTKKQSDNSIIHLSETSDQELKWLYENSEALIQPSIYEGFSLVTFEARSFGCPVLVSDIPVHREILGEDVHYFKLNDSESFKTSLENLLAFKKPLPKPNFNYDFKESAEKWKELISRFE